MKNLIRVSVLAVSLLLVAGTIGAGPKPPDHPLKLVLARQSTIPVVDVMKDFSDRCPNVTITTNPHRSDFMLYAGGWSGEYRFMIIAKGGDTVFATKTVLLSNAVKDVCRFLNSKPKNDTGQTRFSVESLRQTSRANSRPRSYTKFCVMLPFSC